MRDLKGDVLLRTGEGVDFEKLLGLVRRGRQGAGEARDHAPRWYNSVWWGVQTFMSGDDEPLRPQGNAGASPLKADPASGPMAPP